MLILILPIVSIFVAQTLKFLIKSNDMKLKGGKNYFQYSGMPSGHSALVVSLSTITGLTEGIQSPIFAFSVVFAMIVISDAWHLRRYLGQHGETLNVLVKDLKEDQFLDEYYPKLLEKIGHSFPQVVAGGLVGLLVSYGGYMLFG